MLVKITGTHVRRLDRGDTLLVRLYFLIVLNHNLIDLDRLQCLRNAACLKSFPKRLLWNSIYLTDPLHRSMTLDYHVFRSWRV